MATRFHVKLVDRTGVPAGAPLGMTRNEPEVDEAAERLGHGVLADAEIRAEGAHARLDRKPLMGLGPKSELFEYDPGERANGATGSARAGQHADPGAPVLVQGCGHAQPGRDGALCQCPLR